MWRPNNVANTSPPPAAPKAMMFPTPKAQPSSRADRAATVRERALLQTAGVTLIEMLVVVTIIALFASVVGIRYLTHVGQAKRVAAASQIETLENALGIYKLSTGVFPTNEQGLAALRNNPGIANWNGPYLSKELPLDPWGQPYTYHNPGEHSPDPEIISYGADGKPGGTGEGADIVSWKVN
jgi:general secretion pathway protein G